MDIFIVDAKDIEHISDELLKQFEKKKLSNAKKWKEHCLSYLMLDRILREVYKISDRRIIFKKEKPFLASGEKFFSISHSGELIAIAFSDVDCGIDIEQIKPRDYKNIAERMNFKSASLEEFYYDWTKYEAEYKLNNKVKSCKQLQYERYVLTAVSTNAQEQFEIYIQSGEMFSNSQSRFI